LTAVDPAAPFVQEQASSLSEEMQQALVQIGYRNLFFFWYIKITAVFQFLKPLLAVRELTYVELC
jgi:hypothetical protein